MEFDPETNPRNTSLGLPFSALLEAGLSATIQVGNRWDVLGGMGLTHFSNGALREPNVGLNQMSIRLGIQRHFGRIIPFDGGGTDPPGGAVPPLSVRSSALAEPASTWSFFSRLGGGVRSVRFDRSDPVETSAYFRKSYPVFTFMQLFRRSIGPRARVGAGIDVTYDRSTDERRRIAANRADPPLSDHDLSLLDRSGVSMLVGYDQVIGGLSAGIRLGYVVLRSGQLGSDPRFFQEVAFDWSVGPSFSIGVDARFIEFSRSIFLDWGLGYRFGGDG